MPFLSWPEVVRASWLSIRYVCLLLFIFLPSLSYAANLQGVLFSAVASQRIAHASVRLCDEGGNIVSCDSGEFAFLGVRPGPCILRITALGFDSTDVHVELNFASERGISVFLKPAKASSKTLAPGSSVSAHELSMPESARKLFASGMKKLYCDKDAQGATSDFQAAVEKVTDYYEAHYQLGMG